MPKKEMTLEKLAEYALTFFEQKKRGTGEEAEVIYTFKARIPKWLRDMVKVVHEDGGWMPDDYKYEYIVEALGHMSEGMDPEEPQLEADVYTSDLLKWLASHRERLGIVDAAVEEFGWDKERGIEGAISMGQWREKEEVFRLVAEGLKQRLVDIENGEPEIFFSRKGGVEGVLDWEPAD